MLVRMKIILVSLLTLMISLPSAAAVYHMPAPGNDIIGEEFVVTAGAGDTMARIAERYGLSLHEILEANPNQNPDYLYAGAKVLIPTMFILPKYRQGIVINLAELRLYYFTPDGKYVKTYPVGLGRSGWRTPLTSTTVIKKRTNPDWNVPKTIRQFVYEQTGRWLPDVIYGDDPENPLGEYAMYLGKSGYLIHGTNQEWSIGKFISSGCIRLYNADVQELYSQVAVGTPVRIIHHPVKAGWNNGKLYLEAQEPMDLDEPISDLNIQSAEYAIQEATKNHKAQVDWYKVEQVERTRRGTPEFVGNTAHTQHANLATDTSYLSED